MHCVWLVHTKYYEVGVYVHTSYCRCIYIDHRVGLLGFGPILFSLDLNTPFLPAVLRYLLPLWFDAFISDILKAVLLKKPDWMRIAGKPRSFVLVAGVLIMFIRFDLPAGMSGCRHLLLSYPPCLAG